jgi:uncharacterized protein YecE (DUF72 family)
MNKKTIITGCSSFNEVNWKGVFYPEGLPRKDWFAYYCQYFNTYEMNASFYKFPTDKGLSGWYDRAPEGFLFSVKMYKGVTHYKKFRECERLIAEFYETCRSHLKEKLACVLFQLPPSYNYTEEKLQLILGSLDYDFTNVIEFRHISWWHEDVYSALREKGVIFCNVSFPSLPEDIIATTNAGYVRLHGVPKLFYSGYSDDALQILHDDMAQQDWEKAFIYFNNTASAEGIHNALKFEALKSGAFPKGFPI